MFATILNTVKISNWDKHPNINGIVFDTYRFKDVDEIQHSCRGYGAKGYACRCGTSFVSHYQICPNCGNREFTGEELWTANINNSVCNVATYHYFLNFAKNEFFIDKTHENIRLFEETRVNYKEVYLSYPELLEIPKYKALWDIACYLDNHVEHDTWWLATRLLTKIFEETKNYDVELAKQFVDMFDYPSQLTSFLGNSEAIRILAFLKFKNYDIELIKRTNIHDLSFHYELIDKLPKEVITAALKGRHNNLFGSLTAMEKMIEKYAYDPKCINMACYFLENMNLKTPCKTEIPIFMEWAMSTTEEVTMEKFYWYMNAKYIQRADMNDKFEKILTNFDNDPVASLIKLTKA